MSENYGRSFHAVRVASTGGGLKVSFGATHYDQEGNIISRQTSLEPPAAPTCLRVSCLLKYVKDAIFYALVARYHVRRVAYAEKNRRKVILERYRTGDPAPENIWQAIHAYVKLRCPICRRSNRDPLLFRRES